ncbi:hypothetical protein QVD17_16195 [Tagetes erecta]|uniref:Uncharacterized protein n=1 Tax=Tagetes erecta TaxID=13708 RepID=A0AAD8KRP3_TARER|nr:hypothetical protein QVD17_16195 [Tagetes erecta]
MKKDFMGIRKVHEFRIQWSNITACRVGSGSLNLPLPFTEALELAGHRRVKCDLVLPDLLHVVFLFSFAFLGLVFSLI